MLSQSVDSLEYVLVPVSLKESGLLIDPTSDTVSLAFTAEGVAPVTGDWQTGTWETDATTTPDTYSARCLVGPNGDVTLAVGVYDVWVRVTDSPEVPVRKAGNLRIT